MYTLWWVVIVGKYFINLNVLIGKMSYVAHMSWQFTNKLFRINSQ